MSNVQTCPLIVPTGPNNDTNRFKNCPYFFSSAKVEECSTDEDPTTQNSWPPTCISRRYIHKEKRQGMQMKNPIYYLTNWNDLQDRLHKGENTDDVLNFKVVKEIIKKWIESGGPKAANSAFARQYGATTTTDQYEGLLEKCSAPVRDECAGSKSVCPLVKQKGQTGKNKMCSIMYDPQKPVSQRQYLLDQTFWRFCQKCKSEKNTGVYEGCAEVCGCMNRFEKEEPYRVFQRAKDEAFTSSNPAPADHCWWGPCRNRSQGIENPILVTSDGAPQTCPDRINCKIDLNNAKFRIGAISNNCGRISETSGPSSQNPSSGAIPGKGASGEQGDPEDGKSNKTLYFVLVIGGILIALYILYNYLYVDDQGLTEN